MRFGIVLATAVAVVAGGTAIAASPTSPKDMAMLTFNNADSDGDAQLSPKEFDAADMHRFGMPFSAMDLDDDGAVSEAEYLKLFEMHHGRAKQEA